MMIIINIMMKIMIVQELLKKYGFGRWTKPEEVWKGRNISRLSVINTMVIVNIVVMMLIILNLSSGDSGVLSERKFQLRKKLQC